MLGICCICDRSIKVAQSESKRVVASFTLSHYGLCRTCLGRTRADISRIYGQSAAGPGVVPVLSPSAEKGTGI